MDNKQRIINKLYVNAVLNETELLEEPYTIDEAVKRNYEKVIIILAQLNKKGKCDFTYDPFSEPYPLHCINVQWKYDADGYFELEAKEIASILDKMEGIVIDEQNANEWQLSSTIYHKVSI